METEMIDLRELILMIKEKKEMNANLALEFDCKIEVEDYKPLVKVLNYAINYIGQMTSEPIQISLNAGFKGHTLVMTASTGTAEFPEIPGSVSEALAPYDAKITLGGEPGKFVKIQMDFKI